MVKIRIVVVRLASTLFLLALCASLASADIIELNTGQRVEGTFKQLSLTSVSIEIGGQTIRFEIGKIRALFFGSAAGVSAANITPSTSQDALRALKDLRSAVSAAITYRDYGPRVSDTKIRVDRYIYSDPADTGGAAMKRAMEYYVAAGVLWSDKMTGRSAASLNSMGVFQRCKRPRVQEQVADFVLGGSDVALQAMWSCASDDIDQADQILGERK